MKKLTFLFLLICAPAYGQTLSNQAVGSTLDYSFTSRTTTGAPTGIVGGAVVCIKNSSGTTNSSGITFTANFNAITGLNHLTIDLSADTAFYSPRADIMCYMSAGTVGGTSIVGEIVLQFSISSDFTVQKGVAFANFPVWMLKANGDVVTGITPSCTIQKDNGSFVATTNNAAEIGSGRYRLDLTATETNANVFSVICTGSNAVAYRTNITPQQ